MQCVQAGEGYKMSTDKWKVIYNNVKKVKKIPNKIINKYIKRGIAPNENFRVIGATITLRNEYMKAVSCSCKYTF